MKVMKNILFLIVIFFSIVSVAQVTNEVEPRSWSMLEKSIVQPDVIVLPQVDIKSYLSEDIEDKENGQEKSLRIGADIEMNLNLFNDGKWSVLPNGDRLWKMNIKSVDAYFMRVIFDLYSIPEGAELFLYNNDRTDKIGPYTSSENSESGVLGTWIIQGDNLWLEYFEPAEVRGLGRLNIEKITHGYIDVYESDKEVGDLNESGACNVDVLCDPNRNSVGTKDWTNARNKLINSVGRLLISSSRGTGFCSGSLVNNVTQDGTPYFLTANHCLGTDNNKQPNGVGAGYTNSVAFGFQWFTTTPDCATLIPTSGPEQPTRVISGGVVKMNNDGSDTALFLMNQRPPAAWDLFYAGWDNSTTDIPVVQLGMHHPSGDIMKLSRNDGISDRRFTEFNDNPTTQVWLIEDWDYGVTEGGSSGSLLLNENELIIGVLSGGSAACRGTSDNGGFDIYGRLDTNWSVGLTAAQRLRDWLDPNNTGATQLTGSYASTLTTSSLPTNFNDINIFPNPSSGLFTIKTDLPISYQIFNLNGQLINESTSDLSASQLDLTAAANGLYFVKITAGDQTVTRKVIKQ